MVSAGDALPHRAHEEDRPLHARAPRTDPQLFPRSEVALQWDCRGSEQQSQSHHEKILRVPHLPLPRTRALSLTWQTARARIHPRFLLTNLIFQGLLRVVDDDVLYGTFGRFEFQPDALDRGEDGGDDIGVRV